VAAAYLKEDPESCLRRLGVICVEDALLHPRLPVVAWCMAAQVRRQGAGREKDSLNS
jgi:hypothetical protein